MVYNLKLSRRTVLVISSLMTRIEMVPEMWAHSRLIQLTRLLDWQSVIELQTVRSAFFHLSLCTIHPILPFYPVHDVHKTTLNYQSDAVLKQLTLAQLLKKFPTFCEIRKLILVSTSARQGFLYSAIFVLYPTLGLALPSDSTIKILYAILISLTRALCASPSPDIILLRMSVVEFWLQDVPLKTGPLARRKQESILFRLVFGILSCTRL
jgi:hypothetical protein